MGKQRGCRRKVGQNSRPVRLGGMENRELGANPPQILALRHRADLQTLHVRVVSETNSLARRILHLARIFWIRCEGNAARSGADKVPKLLECGQALPDFHAEFTRLGAGDGDARHSHSNFNLFRLQSSCDERRPTVFLAEIRSSPAAADSGTGKSRVS